jgi:DNA-binding transcriptional ArsR family regulator
MDSLLHALAIGSRLEIVRELSRNPGSKHGELLTHLGRDKRKAPQLTRQLEPLEEAGVIKRESGRYFLVDQPSISRLLSAAADADVSAKRILANRAKLDVQAAEELAAELRAEQHDQKPPTSH